MRIYGDAEPITLRVEFETDPDSIPVWHSSDETVAYISSTTTDGMAALVRGVRAGTVTIAVDAISRDYERMVAEIEVTVDEVIGEDLVGKISEPEFG